MTDFIYLDHAAATPLDSEVLEAMTPYFQKLFYNPSASYLPSQKVKQTVSNARSQVAYWLGCKSQDIVFTAGATEANNLAIKGTMDQYPKANLVVSAIEHESVLEPAKLYKHRIVNVGKDGRIDLADLAKKVDENTVLVSIMLASNEIGTIQPMSSVVKVLEMKRRQRSNNLPLLLHSDAAQAANYLDLHTARLKVDLMSLNGSKIYGPKQSGCLYVKSSVKLLPQILGGGQENNLRSGTENVPGIIGFSAALDKAQAMRTSESKRLNLLSQDFIKLLQSSFPKCFINGSIKHRLPNNVHVTFPDTDNERLLLELESEGILAAAGSACSASSGQPSHVLNAIGLSDEMARSSIRFSLGRTTRDKDIKKTINALKKHLDKTTAS